MILLVIRKLLSIGRAGFSLLRLYEIRITNHEINNYPDKHGE